MTLETGEPLREPHAAVVSAADRPLAPDEAGRIDGRYAVATDGRSRTLVLRQRVDPSANRITHRTFPLAVGTRRRARIAPANTATASVFRECRGGTKNETWLGGRSEHAGLSGATVRSPPESLKIGWQSTR
jgi:hypothetical protein